MRRVPSAAFAAAAFAALSLAAFADSFTFSAASMKTVMAKGKERTVLLGNARIVSGTTDIRADRIELYGTDFRYADCSGAVVAVDLERGMKLSGAKLYYDRVARFMRLEGPSIIEDKKNRLVIKGNYVENDDKAEITRIQVNVRILKEDLACRAEFAVYRRSLDLLELTGNPVVYRGSDVYRADKIVVNLETEEITMEGNVQGSVTAGASGSGSEGTSSGGEGGSR